MTKPACFLIVFASLMAAQSAPVDISKLPPPAAREVDFAKDIQPVLQGTCLKCHGPDKAKGKLLLDTREHAVKGGEDGPDIIPGDSAKSKLIHFTARLVEDYEMPPSGKGDPLTKEQVGVFRAWIDQGGKWPEGLVLQAPAEPDSSPSHEPQNSANSPSSRTNHWAFKATVLPAL